MSSVLRSFLLVALGVGSGVVASRVLADRPSDDRAELLRELAGRQAAQFEERAAPTDGEDTGQAMAMAQFYRLQEFRRLGEEGQAVAWVVPVPAGRESDAIAAAAGGASVRIPRIALDPAARDTWVGESARLSGFDGTVDARIFDAFTEVRDFVSLHPWPTAPGLAGLRGSEWATADIIERWLSLNRALVSRVDALLAGP
jgi:hypothetical protein